MWRVAAALLVAGAAWLLGRGFEPRARPLGGGPDPAPRLLRGAELARYRGAPGEPGLYVALLGRVFDVQRGHRHYGPGGAYSGLAGRDASRAFVTGDFSPAGLVDDVSGLPPLQLLALRRWLSFYHHNYVSVGKLVGRYYDENGAPTEALRQAEAAIEEGLRLKAENDQRKQQFPPCNSEWSSATGSRFWCSKQSGGVSRDWVGVPRKLYTPGSRGSRCVCVRATGPPSGELDAPEHRDRGDLDDPNWRSTKAAIPGLSGASSRCDRSAGHGRLILLQLPLRSLPPAHAREGSNSKVFITGFHT